MACEQPVRFTPLEAAIMDCLWRLGPAGVKEVRQALKPERPLAYNTVLTMMRILRDKGFVDSERKGRTDVYRPLVSQVAMGRKSLRELLARFFSGSPAELVSELLRSKDFTGEEILSIRREVNNHLRAAKKGDSI